MRAKQHFARVLALLPPLCMTAGSASADDTLRITALVAEAVTVSPARRAAYPYTVDTNAPTSFTLVYSDLRTFAGQTRPRIEIVAR